LSKDRLLSRPRYRVVGEQERFDERDNVQSRGTLVPGTPDYEEFYRRHPEWKAKDDAVRALPGMGRAGAAADLPFVGAQHGLLADLGREDRVDGPVAPTRLQMSPERATEKVRGFAKHLGADLVRVGPLNPLYVYTHVGKTWHDPARSFGQAIEVPHGNAISLAVGISLPMLRTGPVVAEVAEIMRVYVRLATMAVTLAGYIRALGYPARAHIMSNYRALCVPVAIDAGMGELGRHGLLISKELGSALKLAIVTTELPLVYDPPQDIGVEEFCEDCSICAESCPGGALSQGEQKVIRGVERWAVNPEACFAVWNETGTDCGVCVASCPWNKPRSRFHRLMVEIATRKRKAGWWMSRAHKVFYGRFKPVSPPRWFEDGDPAWKNVKKYQRLL
jgi:ferredoxin